MRRLAVFALAFSAAVFLSTYLIPNELLIYIAAGALLLALMTKLLPERISAFVFLVLTGAAVGLIWCALYTGIFYDSAKELDGRNLELDAYVLDYPDEYSDGSRVLVRIDEPAKIPVRAYLYLSETECSLLPGDRVKVCAYLKLSDLREGERYDYLLTKRIYLMAYADETPVSVHPEALPADRLAVVIRHKVNERIPELFPNDVAGLASALVTSDKSGISKDTSLALQRSGIYHIAVISGVHVAFLIGFICVIAVRRRMRAIIGIPVVLAFMLFTGAAAPVVRAGMLQILTLTAPLLKREEDDVSSLSLSLMLLLASNPYAAASLSLQLSFAATAGIILLGRRVYFSVYARLPQGRLLHYLSAAAASVLSVSFCCMLTTTPLSLMSFGYISLVSPLTNLLTSFAVSAAFIGSMLTAAVSFVLPETAELGAALVTLPLRFIQNTAERISGFRYACVYLADRCFSMWIYFAYTLACSAVLAVCRKVRLRASVLVLVLAVSFAAAAAASAGLKEADATEIKVLDVGQGQCICVTNSENTVMIDCGGSFMKDPGLSAANLVNSNTCACLDLLVLTHLHEDHAGAVPELMSRTAVSAIAMPSEAWDELYDEASCSIRQEILAAAAETQTEIIYIDELSVFDLGSTNVTLYPPLGTESVNERGIAALVSCGEHDTLITGDIDANLEMRLSELYELPDIELLVVGHHGSEFSTDEKLLDALKPELAVISVGYNNYGHPSPEVIRRLNAAGVSVYRTDECGTVSFRIKE